jgi:hypothetical protein
MWLDGLVMVTEERFSFGPKIWARRVGFVSCRSIYLYDIAYSEQTLGPKILGR